MCFISDECDYHTIQIEEEHDQVESEFDEGLLFCAFVSLGGLKSSSEPALSDPQRGTDLLVNV